MIENLQLNRYVVALVASVGAFAFSIGQASCAEEDSKKVLVLMVFDQNCKKFCKEVRPVLKDLKIAYGDKIVVTEVDVTQSVLSEASKRCKELGVQSFLPAAIDVVPCVGIFNEKRKLRRELVGPKKKQVYAKYIDKCLKK